MDDFGDSSVSMEEHNLVELKLDLLDVGSAGSGVFRSVDFASVTSLLVGCPTIVLEPGEVLLERGKANQTMYLIVSGALHVCLDSLDSEPAATLKPGQSVGELSVIDGEPASAYVLAAERSCLLCIGEQIFWSLASASHEFSVNLLALLSERLRSNNRALVDVGRRSREFERAALVDGLTGIHNRRWLDRTLGRLIGRARGDGDSVSVLMLDVDHFKQFNDTFGHAAGDAVLVSVAQCLVQSLRPTDMCARYGGEEFVVLLPSTSRANAVVVAERLRHNVSMIELRSHGGGTLPGLTVSVGVAGLEGPDNASTLLTRADMALYKSKQAGRNRVMLG